MSGRLGAIVLCLFLTSACGEKKTEEAPSPEAQSCEGPGDCPTGQICLDGSCAKMGTKALITDTKNAVTPGKVRKELERVNKQAEKNRDRGLDNYE